MLRTCYGHGLTKGAIVQIFYHGLDDPTQEILDAGGIFLYNTPNEAFKILEDKVILKLDFSDDSQNNPESKIIVFAGGSNLNSDYAILMEKFEALTIKFDSEFLKIRKELKEIEYQDQNSRDSYSYPNQNPNHHYPQSRLQNKMPHPSQHFKIPKASPEEMMKEWMARQTEANERIKDNWNVKLVKD
ncbi:hypothetical protein Tco_1321912 [Tanacetum coccineum]